INNLTDASRYLSVKDTRHARKAALLGTVLFLVGPIIWFIPPMVARISNPSLSETFPALQNPQDAAYFAIAFQTLPVGMLGLLLSSIFAATMSSMDSGLNRNAGFFVKNFYQMHVRPRASERELMVASVLCTMVMGVLIILAALWFASLKKLPIFDMMVNFGAWVALPIAIPLIWGMFLRRAPGWAGWSTVMVGLATSYLTNRYLDAEFGASLLGLDALNAREGADWAQLAGILMNLGVGSLWFVGTTFAHRWRAPREIARVDAFFREMRTPVHFELEEGAHGGGSDNMQARVMGNLCLIYGAFITLLAVLPNPLIGRASFVFCGGVMFLVGWLLRRAARARPVVKQQIKRPELAGAIGE
ncbi:MAG TPA: hypothetical protein PKB10_07930, partial [Tepidisphaeraceae bacterium]|nr:hypothetical protein [Tepidisphaeraceae bacterium]